MRSSKLAAAAAILSPLLALGCGHGHDDDDDTTPTATPTPTQPPDGVCVAGGCRALHTFYGGANAGQFGWAVADIGDLDGDGIREAAMGAPFGSAGGPSAGAILVYSGASGALLHELTGSPGDFLGWALADAGDVNGDGITDIVGGAPDATQAGGGRVLIYSGVDGAVLMTLSDDEPGSYFGYAVASAGDVNGDGKADVVVGLPGADVDAAVDVGRARIYSGADGSVLAEWAGDVAGAYFGSGTARVDDLDGDGVSEVIIGAPGGGGRGQAQVFSGGAASPLFTFTADPGSGAYGDFFVADAGDVNGDGTPDLYVGDYAHGGGNGRAYVYSGADGANLYTWAGVGQEGLGCGRGAGDVDGDGYDDLATGGYTSNEGAPQSGKVYLRSGADGSTLRELVSATEGEQLGFDAVGMGDVNADGVVDLLVAAPPGETVYIIAGE